MVTETDLVECIADILSDMHNENLDDYDRAIASIKLPFYRRAFWALRNNCPDTADKHLHLANLEVAKVFAANGIEYVM